jgi:UDP-glucose 4-epimerase
VRAAHEQGRSVVVLDDGSGGAGARLPSGVRLLRGDIGDSTLVSALCRDHRIDAVVHFAGKIQVAESVRIPEVYFDVNLARSMRLLDAVLAAGVRTVLFSSTAAVYGDPDSVPIVESARLAPLSPYGSSKLAFEYVLAAYGVAHGLRWAALRYFNAAGAHPNGTIRESHDPETHLIPLVVDAALGRRAPPTVFGTDYPTSDGTCIRDYVHVCDLAIAHLAAIDTLAAGTAVGAVNLASGVGFSVRAVIDTVARIAGHPIPHAIGPRRAGDPAALLADPSRAAAVLGWRPVRSELEVIVEDTLRSRRG